MVPKLWRSHQGPSTKVRTSHPGGTSEGRPSRPCRSTSHVLKNLFQTVPMQARLPRWAPGEGYVIFNVSFFKGDLLRRRSWGPSRSFQSGVLCVERKSTASLSSSSPYIRRSFPSQFPSRDSWRTQSLRRFANSSLAAPAIPLFLISSRRVPTMRSIIGPPAFLRAWSKDFSALHVQLGHNLYQYPVASSTQVQC